MSIYGQQYRFGLGAGLTPAVKYLLIANISVFVLQQFFSGFIRWFGLTPTMVIENFVIWQFFSYMFLHGDLWHILLNMFILWMFGSELERHWGSREFIKYYFICGVGAGLFHMIFSFSSTVPVIGASGAIYGLLAAFGLLFPERVITLLLMFVLPVQIKAKYLVMIMAGIALFSGIFGGDSGIAHFAHLGGMLVGFIYLKMDWRWSALGRKAREFGSYQNDTTQSSSGENKLTNWFKQRSESKRQMEVVRRRQHEMHLRERVDIILDKINEVGYDNLTDEEKEVLKRASELLSKEKARPQDYGPN